MPNEKDAEKYCSDERSCINCFADQGKCLDTPKSEEKEDAKSVWGIEIHKDHNGVSATHNQWFDTDNGQQELDHGHFYDIQVGNRIVNIDFQHGPVKEHGVNGLTSEALLSVLIHRTKILNDRFPCDENKRAITYMENALALFEQRTKDRLSRGVEGQNKI